jgi:hypothetical protein
LLSKKITYLFLIVFCVHAYVKTQNTFNLNYTSGIKSAAFGIEEVTPNKYFVNSVFVDSAFGQQGLDLKILNNQGIITKCKRYLFKDIDFLTYFNNKFQHKISNSTMLINGSSYTGTASTIIFTSVNKNTLDTNWTRYYYDGIYNYYLNTVFKVNPNQFWLFGGRGNNNGISNRPTAIKIDSLGNILSIKEFTNFVKYSVQASYYDTLSKLIYFAGKNHNPTTSIECMACMDTLGNIVWTQQNYGPITFSQIERKNNYVVAVGSIYTGDFAPPSTINPTFKLNILKVNANNGGVIWQKQYGQRRATNYLTSFVINTDESIVTTGCYFPITAMYAGVTDGILLKVNNAGDSLWSQTYGNFGGSVQEAFYDIKKTNDNGYIMCGVPFYATDPTSQSWVVKTDSLGIAPGKTTSVEDLSLSKEAFIIFPNPASNKLQINLKQNVYSGKNVNVEITDLLGKQVFIQQITSPIIELEISSLAVGSYIIQIKNQNTIQKSKLIISR